MIQLFYGHHGTENQPDLLKHFETFFRAMSHFCRKIDLPLVQNLLSIKNTDRLNMCFFTKVDFRKHLSLLKICQTK